MKVHIYPQVDLTVNNLFESSSPVIDLQDQNLKLTQSNKTLILVLAGTCVAVLITVVIYFDKRREDDK